MDLIHNQYETNGVFLAKQNNKTIGEMTYSKAGDSLYIIDHTEVLPGYEGLGIGKKLVMEAVNYARLHKIKILPLCPFAKATFDRNPDIQDVL